MSNEMIDFVKEWKELADSLIAEKNKLQQQLIQSQRDLRIALRALESINNVFKQTPVDVHSANVMEEIARYALRELKREETTIEQIIHDNSEKANSQS